MKHSSLIFVGGFTLVFGFFAAESYDADADALRTAEIRASQLQADLIANAGCYLATYYMATPSFWDGWSVTDRAMNGGRMSYTITITATDGFGNPRRAVVVSRGTIGEVTVVKRAELVKGVSGRGKFKDWDQWTINKLYTDPYSLADPRTDPTIANSTSR
ncbi:MAG: hypothetical protein MUE68_07930 [Bacteroidetes bacterium]|jgi:hypothetical protein|nr:hypothetical protein [Bacteroidota bacterium]